MVTTPAGGPWDNVTFSWLLSGTVGGPSDRPRAYGNLFVFDQPFTGMPSDLINAHLLPGFLGQSVSIVADHYILPPALTLQPGTPYFFYADEADAVSVGPARPGELGLRGSSFTPYVDDISGDPLNPLSHDYRLGGNPVPEPSSALLALAGLAICASRRNRGRKAVDIAV